MVPLALANVLVNDLLARARFGVVPWMVLLAAAYGFALPAMLNHFPGRLEVVLQTWACSICCCSSFARGSPGAKRDRKSKVVKSQSRAHPTSSLSSYLQIGRRQRLRLAKFFVNPAFQRTQRTQPFVKQRVNQPDAHHGQKHGQRRAEK